MRTLVFLNAKRLERWHAWLISRLAADPVTELCVHLTEVSAPSLPHALRLLLDVERYLAKDSPSAADAITASNLGHAVTTGADLPGNIEVAFDLTGAPNLRTTAARVIIQPTFDGSLSESALWSALLSQRAPLLGLKVGAVERSVGLPALENPTRLRTSADQVFSRVVQTLAAAALQSVLPAEPRPIGPAATAANASTLGAVRFAWNKVDAKADRALARLLGTQERWRVGWRLAPHGRSHTGGLASAISYRVLGDDGARYYADPFILLHEGVHHVFVEELPTATGRGIISHFTVSPEGRPTAVRPVLETAHHLSYPQVFVHEGKIYMMPECSASGALDLYRADPFPDRWVPVFRLLDEEVHDATLVEHHGRFYLLAATRTFASSSWDALSVYWADRLQGPWQPLPQNPTLIDVRESRPAGALYQIDGELWRPAQNCTDGYGASLSLSRVTRLDPGGFAQQHVTELRMPGRAPAQGPHTINWAQGLEVVDFLA